MLSYLHKKGLISLENYFDDSSKFKDNVYDYYRKGLKLIIDGRPPEQVAFMLEYEKMKWIKNSNNSVEDLLLITIIQGVIPCLQKADFDGFYNLCCLLFSKKQTNEIGDLLAAINPDMWDKYSIRISKNIDTILNSLEGCHLYSCSIEQYMKKFNQKDKLNEVKIIKDFTLANLTYNWFIEFEGKEIYFDIISSKNKVDENVIKAKIDFANKNSTDNHIFVTTLIYKDSKENIDEKVIMEEDSLNNIDDFLCKSLNCTDKDILDSNRKVTMLIRSGKITFDHMCFIIFKGV